MANPVELAIKVKADTARLWADLTKAGAKADETTRKIDATTKAAERAAKQAEQSAGRVRTAFAHAGQGLGAAGGVLASGGDLGTAVAALVGSAFPELAAAVAGARGAGGLIDRLQGEAGQISRAQAILQNPTSVAEAAAALRSQASAKAGQFSFGRFFRQGGDLLTKNALFGGRETLSPGNTDRARELRKGFRDLVRTNPALALDVLAQLGNPADLARVYRDETAAQAAQAQRVAASESFLTRYTNTSVTVNAAVNVSADAAGGRGSVGRTVTAYQDIRDRNNGRQVPASRR